MQSYIQKGMRRETGLNQWGEAEKQQFAVIVLEHRIEWKQKAELEEHNVIMQEVNEKWITK